jgi:hypothetical protein
MRIEFLTPTAFLTRALIFNYGRPQPRSTPNITVRFDISLRLDGDWAPKIRLVSDVGILFYNNRSLQSGIRFINTVDAGF